MFTADYFIKQLDLQPHVEGGFFREIYHSSGVISNLPKPDEKRCLASTIYYLLRSGEVSRFHRLKSDEIWFYHFGSPLIVHIINEDGILEGVKLGLDLGNGEVPQVLVPANQVFGAEVMQIDSFCLVSCMVSPGFDYRDFELFSSQQLIEMYPGCKDLIVKLNGD